MASMAGLFDEGFNKKAIFDPEMNNKGIVDPDFSMTAAAGGAAATPVVTALPLVGMQ